MTPEDAGVYGLSTQKKKKRGRMPVS